MTIVKVKIIENKEEICRYVEIPVCLYNNALDEKKNCGDERTYWYKYKNGYLAEYQKLVDFIEHKIGCHIAFMSGIERLKIIK